jgi:beta-galactosidase
VDDRGRIVPDCNVPVKFEIEGPGASIGVGNGDPTSALSEKGLSRPLFNGYAQILVQTKSGEPGDIRITAKSPDLKDGSCSIRAMEAPALKVIEGLGTGENRR